MRAVVAGTRWAAPRLTPDKDTVVSTGLPSFQPRPHSGSTVRLLTSSLITPRCTPLTPRPCLSHWCYGLWGFWKTCSSYTTGFQFSYFEISSYCLFHFFKQWIFRSASVSAWQHTGDDPSPTKVLPIVRWNSGPDVLGFFICWNAEDWFVNVSWHPDQSLFRKRIRLDYSRLDPCIMRYLYK